MSREPERYYWRKPAPPKVGRPPESPEFLAWKRAGYEEALAADCEASRLAPCPKCGNRTGVRMVKLRDLRGRISRKQYGRCDPAGGGCGLAGRVGWSATDAEKLWNDPEWREGVGG